MPAAESHVLARVEGRLGHLTLNRPEALNALSHNMVAAVHCALREWAVDDEIRTVVIDGAGQRGLCAGGDIRAIYDDMQARTAASLTYWADEYRMNFDIATYPKPVVVFMDGFVMGGGVGIAGHASHRVVNASSIVAMPEVLIGFVPDVGGTYLLSRAPGELGTHFALTSDRMDGAGAIACGFADFWISPDRREDLVHRLADGDTADKAVQAVSSSPPPSGLHHDRSWIDVCYAGDSVEQIIERLDTANVPAAKEAARKLRTYSPTALKVTLRAVREAQHSDLSECLRREYRIASRLHAGHDFADGIRARIVDRAHVPAWVPPKLSEVSDADLDRYFEGLGLDELDLAVAIRR